MNYITNIKIRKKTQKIFLNILKETAIDCKHNCFSTKSKEKFLTEIDYNEEKLTAFKKVTRKTEFAKKTIDGVPYVTLETKNPDGTRAGDIKVYNYGELERLRQGEPVEPLGILVDGKLQRI